MTRRRTWLGLLAAILAALVLWWQQGDGTLTAEEPGAGPTASPSVTPTDVAESSDAPALPAPEDTGTAHESPSLDGSVDPESGLPVTAEGDLPPEALDTLALIDGGGPYPYDQDDGVFQNREQILPDRSEGYYREYTVETPGSDDRGARRIVTGASGEFYWTDDHYTTFSRIVRSSE